MISAVLLTCIVSGHVVAASEITGGAPSRSHAAVFQDAGVPTFKSEVNQASAQALGLQSRRPVPGTLADGTDVVRNVGLRLKGRSTFQPLDQKPSFTLKFDQFAPGQRFHGLKKLHLNNSVMDRTYLHEWLAAEVFHEAGLPAARVSHARVELNGRDLGLYVVVEGLEKVFLRHNFAHPSGNFYDNLGDIDGRMVQHGGSDRSQADIKALLGVALEKDPGERWATLPNVLDVDQFLSFLALEALVGQSDGYAGNANNYRIYHDPKSDRFVFIPHGLDLAFASAAFSLMPRTDKVLTRAVLQTWDGRRAYRRRVVELYTNIFRVEVLTNKVNEAVARLQSAAKTPEEALGFQTNGAALCRLILERSSNIAAGLALPDLEPLRFDESGTARLAGWKGYDAACVLVEKTNQDSRAAFQVRSPKTFSTGWWGTRVLLEPGEYELVGRIRTRGVEPLCRSGNDACGVGLRVWGRRGTEFRYGNSGWTESRTPFAVEYGPEEVELMCLLEASKGEAWFDGESLRVRRLTDKIRLYNGAVRATIVNKPAIGVGE